LTDLENELTNNGASIASVIGRYYAMDRDKRWERVKKAYDLLIHGTGTPSQNIAASIQSSYDNGITDEFIDPIVRVDENNQPIATIEEDDVVLFFNFRTDRGRELTEVLSQSDLTEFGMKKRSLYFVTMTNYNDAYKRIKVMYDKENIQQTLGEVLSEAGKTQIRIAETEKYPHVTFFFNGGKEAPFQGEKRILCPSPKVATYDLQPCPNLANLCFLIACLPNYWLE
jgi:2,3-bisphosphoglycerate-independent phosphoglycerate mutase